MIIFQIMLFQWDEIHYRLSLTSHYNYNEKENKY